MDKFEEWFQSQDFYTNLRFIHGDALFLKDGDVYRVLTVRIASDAWQEQQKRVDELQAKCDQLEMQILRSKFFRVHEYSNQNIERLWREFIKKSHRCIECSNFDVCSCGGELEQALKGGED